MSAYNYVNWICITALWCSPLQFTVSILSVVLRFLSHIRLKFHAFTIVLKEPWPYYDAKVHVPVLIVIFTLYNPVNTIIYQISVVAA